MTLSGAGRQPCAAARQSRTVGEEDGAFSAPRTGAAATTEPLGAGGGVAVVGAGAAGGVTGGGGGVVVPGV